MERIGVRELRQHASRYLERVARGETVEVTDRGRLVARLVPVADHGWEAMVAAGRVVLASAEDGADIVDEAPVDYGVDATATLVAMRADDR